MDNRISEMYFLGIKSEISHPGLGASGIRHKLVSRIRSLILGDRGSHETVPPYTLMPLLFDKDTHLFYFTDSSHLISHFLSQFRTIT